MMKMQNVVCLLVGLLVYFSALTASAEEEKKRENSLNKGAWAMQFEVVGSLLDFQVSDYLGETFSGKYHIADRRALRLGVDLEGFISDMKAERNSGGSSNPYLVTDNVRSDHFIQFVLHHLWYLRENNGFFLVAGVGPMLNLDVSNYDVENKFNHEDESNDELGITNSKKNSHYAGLSGALGFEYFVRKNIGISLEFQSSFGYMYYLQDSKSKRIFPQNPDKDSSYSDTIKTHRVVYNSNRVKVGVSIYF